MQCTMYKYCIYNSSDGESINTVQLLSYLECFHSADTVHNCSTAQIQCTIVPRRRYSAQLFHGADTVHSFHHFTMAPQLRYSHVAPQNCPVIRQYNQRMSAIGQTGDLTILYFYYYHLIFTTYLLFSCTNNTYVPMIHSRNFSGHAHHILVVS
jgi:hypothetical protein